MDGFVGVGVVSLVGAALGPVLGAIGGWMLLRARARIRGWRTVSGEGAESGADVVLAEPVGVRRSTLRSERIRLQVGIVFAMCGASLLIVGVLLAAVIPA